MNEPNTLAYTAATPLVTVALCTYNGERFLEAQIQSILAQTYPLLELIINDDGSTDGTLPLVKKWMEKDSRVRLFQNETNLGYNRNFAKTITLGSGELIALSDQDDLWHPQKLEKLVALFANPQVVLAHSAAASIKASKISYRAARHRHLFRGSDPRPLFFQNQIAGHAMVFRRSLLPRILPLPPNMYYDWWIAATAAVNGRVEAVDQCLVYHRLHDENSFFQKEAKNKRSAPDFLKLLGAFKGLNGLSREDAAFLERFRGLVEQHRTQKPAFNKALFSFLWQHRLVFFGYKKRLFPAFTYLKYCLRYARKQW